METGKVASIIILAVILSVLAAMLVAWRYRAAMKRLMSAPPGAAVEAPELPAAPPSGPLASITLEMNRQAYRRLIALFVGLSLLMALTEALIEQQIAGGVMTWKTVTALTLVLAWPVILVLGVIERWSRLRVVLLLASWFIFGALLTAWRTTEVVTMPAIIGWLAYDMGIPLLLVGSVCLGSATRAIAPWMLPLFVALSAASMLGLDALYVLVFTLNANSVLFKVSEAVGFRTVMIAFGLLPMLFAWWPAKILGRWLAMAYTRRRFSELFYLFTAVWALSLIPPALGAASDSWLIALADFAPLLWIPLSYPLLRALRLPVPPGQRPPTLLVLRVFQQDVNVQNLFDRVIERWRLTGNTVLIAGTDLADRTIDADDVFTFLDGRLGERFVSRVADLDARLQQFEFQPDIEGRYRVNECYCHDSTWQQALDRLVAISDVVLMDLRNFKAKNAGCVHELGVLAKADKLSRVVILSNQNTERGAAEAAAASAPAGHFVWIEEGDKTSLQPAEVLAALFPATPAASANSGR
jgi:hypothetical protein